MTAEPRYAWETPETVAAKRFLLDYEFEELRELFAGWGFKEANAAEIFMGVQRRGYTQWSSFERRAPRALLERLQSPDAPPLNVFSKVEEYPSSDGSVKFAFFLEDGNVIESVSMPFGDYQTLCVSAQVGCALGCTFCATGAMGFRRQLTPAEIVGQVLHMRREHRPANRGFNRYNVVFMGMGEPLHNLDNVLKAFRMMTHRHGMVLSAKDIAVSTSGLVPKIEMLARQTHRPRLMVSIAATTDEARSAIMPVNRAYSLETLLCALERFPLGPRERIMLSYVLIAGVNDRAEDAVRLSAMSRRFPSLVNLIPMNEHADSPGMTEPDEAHLRQFLMDLRARGVFTTIRRSRGRDVAGACGQLANLSAASTARRKFATTIGK